MALSMTGCGEAVVTDGASTCRVELRSVNNRFFKLTLRSREGFGILEGQIEAALRQRVRRGAVQTTLDVTGPAGPSVRRLDADQLGIYLEQLQDFCTRSGLPALHTIDALLQLPGVFVDRQPTSAAIQQAWPLVSLALAEAIDRLDRMRCAEGAAMAQDMRITCGEIVELILRIRNRVPAVLVEYRNRLLERVSKLLESSATTLTASDVAREVAIIADRSDIAEELVRLESHLAQFERLLGEESPGRSLDFLTQELSREANTIASKSLDVTVSHAVVELKSRIERLRELVQNVE